MDSNWTVLPHHKSDYKGFPNEDAVRDAMKPQNLAPGLYDIPHIASREMIKDPETRRKFDEGPAGFFTVAARGVPSMGRPMVVSFLYNITVSIVVAYIAGRTLHAGAEYLTVFRVSGTVAWLAYGAAIIPESIWFARPWSSTVKWQVDALAYGLLTAGVFGWLWPGV